MARSVRLLLTENVDNLGIVGDIVNVRSGYARNFLLPRGLATEPSDDVVRALAEKRAEAEREQSRLRSEREAVIGKLDGLELTMTRACNDQGQLYGSVTQQDIASALGELGYQVLPREVRLAHTIKRLDTYEVHIKFDSDLDATIKIWVVADRQIDVDEREEMEFDDEGNLIEPSASKQKAKAGATPEAGAQA